MRKCKFVGNAVMRDLNARHPKWPTGDKLYRACRRGRTFMDTDPLCVNYASKRPEFNRGAVGLVAKHWSLYGEQYGEVILTGWHIFTYSGRGSAHECRLADGRIAWLSEVRPTTEQAYAPVEPFEVVPEVPTEHVGTFFGVRVPKRVRFFDLRSAEGKEFRRMPITPPIVLSETCTVTDVDDEGWIATQVFGLKLYGSYYTPHSCTHYVNTRNPGNAHWAADAVMDIRRELAKMLRAWRKWERGQETFGGERPLWVEFNNFGWSIVANYRSRRSEG